MPKPEVGQVDAEILRTLQQDARLTNLELAAKTGLSPSSCLRRVRALQAAGVITGFRAMLDRQRVGLNLTTFLTVDIERHASEVISKDFRSAIAKMPEVVACHIVSGNHDFLLEVVTPDLNAYRTFLVERLLRLPMIVHAESRIVIETVKSPAPLPLGHIIEKATP
jgi:Lrp/AsnC family transcriptional regulator, leucine-responsive regulatory protein